MGPITPSLPHPGLKASICLYATVLLFAFVAMPSLLELHTLTHGAGLPHASKTRPDPSNLPGVMSPWFKPQNIKGGGLLDLLKARRLARGDAKGAARVDTLRNWFSFFGLYRGMPALGMDLFRHRGLAAEVMREWGLLMESLVEDPPPTGAATVKRVDKAHSDNFLELLAVHQQTILDWVRKMLRKVKKAFKGGAVSRLLGDLYTEVSLDTLFVSDVMESAEQLGWQGTLHIHSDGPAPKEVAEFAQQVFEVIREELFPDVPAGPAPILALGSAADKATPPIQAPSEPASSGHDAEL